jgi:predicted transposase/invertase (TIGR01784 family)
MQKYLDPKNDLLFKKVFGENKHLCISLLNSLLKFEDDDRIKSIEYDTSEIIHENIEKANTIVDVRCRDGNGREFIVEMQLYWIREYDKRVIFNASKLFIRQVGKSGDIKLAKPVYSLNFVNDIFDKEKKMEKEFYHHYKIVNIEHTEKQIEGLEFIFIELPKYKKLNSQENSYFDLWLRFLTEINPKTEVIPSEFFEKEELKDAIKCVEMASLSEEERYIYDRVFQAKWMHDTIIEVKEKEGEEKGRIKGKIEGKMEGKIEVAQNLKKIGLSLKQISEATGFSLEELQNLN